MLFGYDNCCHVYTLECAPGGGVVVGTGVFDLTIVSQRQVHIALDPRVFKSPKPQGKQPPHDRSCHLSKVEARRESQDTHRTVHYMLLE